jgi:hypothetical protein
MSFDWEDFLQLARSLNGEDIKQDLSDAKNRSAVSRAYYAAFNISKYCISNHCGIDYNSADIKSLRQNMKAGDHEITYKLLQTSDNLDVRMGGSNLSTLRGKRRDCDYFSESANPNGKEVADSIRLAHNIITSLNLLINQTANVDIKRLQSIN